MSKLKSLIPNISEKMIIQELKLMMDSGLVHRENIGEVLPRVEYSLTEKGEFVKPLIKGIVEFAKDYTSQIIWAVYKIRSKTLSTPLK